MAEFQNSSENPVDKKEIEHRFKEAEEISREYPFSPEDVYYAYQHFGWDRDNTETILILALTHGVSPYDMIRTISHVNISEDEAGEEKRQKKHFSIHQMKLRDLSGLDRGGLFFCFSYKYHFKDHYFNVFIDTENTRKLCRKLFDLDEVDAVRGSDKREFLMAAILKEVFTVFSRYPIEIILTLDEFEITGDHVKGLRGIEWDYDGENEITLTKPDRISFSL